MKLVFAEVRIQKSFPLYSLYYPLSALVADDCLHTPWATKAQYTQGSVGAFVLYHI